MANGPLRTFFRQDAGYPQEEPDMTDFLLESMIKTKRGMPSPYGTAGMVPKPTSLSRTSGMMQMAPQEQQVDITASPYPQMPGPPPAARQMPQMRRQGWADVLGQALAGAGDVFSAGGGRPTNFLHQTMGRQDALRGQEYHQALANRGALEQADAMAREYGWKTYGAGVQERRQDFSEEQQRKQMDLYQQMLGKEKEKEAHALALLDETLPLEFGVAENTGQLDALLAKALSATGGDPDRVARVRRAYQLQFGKIAAKQAPGPIKRGLQGLSNAILPPDNPLSPFGPEREWDFNPSNFSRNLFENWWGPQAWDQRQQPAPSPAQRFNPYPIPR